MLDIYKLQNQYLSLQYRTRALRSQSTIPVEEAEGFELTEKTPAQSTGMEVSNEKVMAIKKEWRGWKLASIKNTYASRLVWRRSPLTISGYGPLTLHWGAGPMWTSPLITSVLGCVAATAKIAEEWDRQG
jgi:hypothetical protein